MSWLSAFRAAAVTSGALGWAVACGSAGSTTATSALTCLIYFGGGFTPAPPDGASLCPAGSCNFQSQVGCPANANCFPHYDAASNTVVPTCGVAGKQGEGQPCDSAAELCERGFVCADGLCAKSCCGGDYTACGAGESCIRSATRFKTSSGSLISYDEGLGTCAPVGNCNLLDATACASDSSDRTVCRIVDPRGSVACSPPGTRDLGEPCDESNQCGRGQHCAGNVEADGASLIQTTCVRLCRFGSCDAQPACAANEGPCVHFTRDPDGVGECTKGWAGPGLRADGGVPSATDAGTLGNKTRD